ncbi:M23 family metallopeptidase [Paraburkholderia acidiphila]|nr:M23 family metallopeptidase [Paraburkholderia acidiphila]
MGPIFLMLSLFPKRYLNDLTHRASRVAVIVTACVVALIAFAAGIAAGRCVGSVPDAGAIGHHVVAGEIGRASNSAASALPDPRIEHLAAQLAALNQFNERLRAQPPRGAATEVALAPARTREDSTAEGGPELPPRPCLEASAARERAKAANGGIDCMAATLSALERSVAQHEAAWDAFPGRRPIQGGRDGSPFGNRIDPFTHRLSFHPGVDLVAAAGTPILAAAGGRVIYAGPKRGYGNAVEIDHGNGFITRYGHASKIDVRVGEVVLPREHIADVGSTGRSTGPHLHFEVLVNGQAVNPAGYLALFAPVLDG